MKIKLKRLIVILFVLVFTVFGFGCAVSSGTFESPQKNSKLKEFSSSKEMEEFYFTSSQLTRAFLIFDTAELDEGGEDEPESYGLIYNETDGKMADTVFLTVYSVYTPFVYGFEPKIEEENLEDYDGSASSDDGENLGSFSAPVYSMKALSYPFEFREEFFDFEEKAIKDDSEYDRLLTVSLDGQKVMDIFYRAEAEIPLAYFQTTVAVNTLLLRKDFVEYKYSFPEYREDFTLYKSHSELLESELLNGVKDKTFLVLDLDDVCYKSKLDYQWELSPSISYIFYYDLGDGGETEEPLILTSCDIYDQRIGPKTDPDIYGLGGKNISLSLGVFSHPFNYENGTLRFEKYKFSKSGLPYNNVVYVYCDGQLALCLYYETEREVPLSYFKKLVEDNGIFIRN